LDLDIGIENNDFTVNISAWYFDRHVFVEDMYTHIQNIGMIDRKLSTCCMYKCVVQWVSKSRYASIESGVLDHGHTKKRKSVLNSHGLVVFVMLYQILGSFVNASYLMVPNHLCVSCSIVYDRMIMVNESRGM
jgi:hypothetical protein